MAWWGRKMHDEDESRAEDSAEGRMEMQKKPSVRERIGAFVERHPVACRVGVGVTTFLACFIAVSVFGSDDDEAISEGEQNQNTYDEPEPTFRGLGHDRLLEVGKYDGDYRLLDVDIPCDDVVDLTIRSNSGHSMPTTVRLRAVGDGIERYEGVYCPCNSSHAPRHIAQAIIEATPDYSNDTVRDDE